MNREIRDQWVAALRSGEYSQGAGALQKEGQFCCLGVLCDLAVKAGVVTQTILPRVAGEETMLYGKELNSSVLPDEVMQWAEIDAVGQVTINLDKGHPEATALTTLNDEYSYGFEAIADVIENHL